MAEEQQPMAAEQSPAPAAAETAAPAAPAADEQKPFAADAAKDPGPPLEDDGFPKWPELTPDHPLAKFESQLDKIIAAAEYDEVFGIPLQNSSHFHRCLILQKFLRANANDMEKAKTQLLETLKWRKTFLPLQTLDIEFKKDRFDGLGYVAMVENVPDSPNARDVVTFNIYGAVTNNEKTFGDLEGFMRWRVGMMELSLAQLHLSGATQPIPDYGKGPDPYQTLQVHDYLSVSFLRQNPHAKAAAKRAIEVFQSYYPETLSRKFFVNVPTIMGWMFAAAKMLMSKETVKKFTVLSDGKGLVHELGPGVPPVYGGKGEDLTADALTMRVEAVE